jgi:membrane-associated phospholipid phosphatase
MSILSSAVERGKPKVEKPNYEKPNYQYHPLASFHRPTQAVFLDQLGLVESYADLRPDRAAEIVSQLGVPHAFFGSITYLHPERTRWTMELIYTALRFAYAVVMRTKYALACRRPHEYSPQIQPIIACPLHGSLPSGHATEAFLFAHLLAVLSTDKESLHGQKGKFQSVWVNQLMRQANRIAVNRTVAGVHFPIDSVAGALLGLTLAEYLVTLCAGKQEQDYHSCRFVGAAYPSRADFNWQNFYDVTARMLSLKEDFEYASVKANAYPLPKPSKPLEWLWKKAKSEWSPAR